MSLSDPRSKKILVVEDDLSVREMLQHFLETDGFAFEMTADGMEAMEKIASGGIDLIILDMMLPGTSGIEIIRQLQAGDWRNIPIVVVTGRFLDPQHEQLIRIEPNVAEFLKKPVHYSQLVELLHKLLKTQPRQSSDGGIPQN